jgi:YVTN family beta-propeller protein
MNPYELQLLASGMKGTTPFRPTSFIIYGACVLLLMLGAIAAQAQSVANPPTAPTPPATSTPPAKLQLPAAKVTGESVRAQRIVEQGIAVEFTIDPLRDKLPKPMAGEDTVVQFKVTDTTTGTPVKGLSLSVWMSLRAGEKRPDDKQCREKIQSFVGGSMRARPDVDLNSYYILALNKSADISVIDPLMGFGGSKLLALVMLKSPGEDWVLSRDEETLFVTLPLINQVAVVNTRSWSVASYIDTGINPARLILQPDQKYLWVANDGNAAVPGSVTVIDAVTMKVAAQIPTGVGHHEIVISGDNRFAFVSNRESGTVLVIDVRNLTKLNDITVGAAPSSMARSELSKAIYVTSETDGSIAVIDEQSQQILARMQAKPGLRSVRFAPGGRYGFAINTNENVVNIFDAASNRLLHDVKIGKAPAEIIFSDTFAFIRSLGTETVAMIRLATIGTDVEITDFPGGQLAPEKASAPVSADAFVLAPEGNAIIVANPADKVIYYYTEGMAAPMGNFQNYRREPRAVLVVDRSLRETNAGVYTTTVKLPASGNYDVAFLADSPRIAHCFAAAAEVNPLMKEAQQVALRLEHQIKEMKLPVGQNLPLRFKLIDTKTNLPKDDLKDVRVLTFLASGTWQMREIAKSVGDGVYEVNLNVPQAGFYKVFVESASMHVRYKDLPHLTLQAMDEKMVPVSLHADVVNKP